MLSPNCGASDGYISFLHSTGIGVGVITFITVSSGTWPPDLQAKAKEIIEIKIIIFIIMMEMKKNDNLTK